MFMVILYMMTVTMFMSKKPRYVLVHTTRYPGKSPRLSTRHFTLSFDAEMEKESIERELGLHSEDNVYLERIEKVSSRETIVITSSDSCLHHLKIEKVK